MIAFASENYHVADLMQQHAIDLDEMQVSTGIDADVLEAIVHERYTPSLDQRNRVASVLGVRPEQIVWGHRNFVQWHLHGPI